MVGPDGAGKTTLIRLFCGLLPPQSGSCKVLGLDTVKDKSAMIKKIGYLSQRFSLYGDLTISENVNFFAEIHGLRNFKKKKKELLEFMGIEKFSKRRADKLSGGMKQKLALACTLIHTPEIIFLDEPTNGVDPVARREFWKILKTVADDGVSVVISTPYLDEAGKCDKICFMNEGEVIERGAPEELKKKFKGTIAEVVMDDCRSCFEAIKSVKGVSSVQLFGDKIHAVFNEKMLSSDQFENKIKEIVAYRRFRIVEPTMEDVFISLLEEKKDE
jgi:ABC-2 type transport system ATP-binding protein